MTSREIDSSSSQSSSDQDERRLRNEKLQSLRRLAYGASHEINNPLANIASRAQALLNGETDPNRRHELATIYAQAMRGHEMIADLMLFARPSQPQLADCRLSEIAQACFHQMNEAARQQQTLLKLETPHPEIRLKADANQLVLALCAIVRNGLEALKQDGQIEISLAQADHMAIVSVQDDGPGIPDEMAELVFDPFHSGREAGRGLGFGLTKCWTIAHAHGGDVYIDTAYGPGARIVLEIPISPSSTSPNE
ncbi:HAMP domain-containing sensor histidine kinase [Bremerella cremea]|uniref:sensor histidine kinase n=1 Tax=Bremerella cremea TaxID=1031537 RepID=UPI0031E98616